MFEFMGRTWDASDGVMVPVWVMTEEVDYTLDDVVAMLEAEVEDDN